MHILFATAEIAPFCPDSEVATTCHHWSSALQAYRPPRRYEGDVPGPNPVKGVSIITPLYGFIDKAEWGLARRLQTLTVPLEGRDQEVVIWEGRTSDRVRVFFLEHRLFERTKYIFGPPGKPRYKETSKKFGFFSRAVVEFCRHAPLQVDVVHCHDWPTGLVPVYLDAEREGDARLEPVLTCMSLYGLSDQGVFEASEFESLGLDASYGTPEALLRDGQLNFTQGGVLFGDVIATPSPTWTDEILSEPSGEGLSEVLDYRGEDLFGVLRGVSYEGYDPRTDPYIPVKYDLAHLNGKRRNKSEVQHIFGLPLRPLVPVVGYVGPLTKGAGVQRLVDALGLYLEGESPVQVIVLGEGEASVQGALLKLQEAFPKQVGLHFGADEALQHHVLAGVDMLVVPGRQAPFEAGAIRAMRYGTVLVAPNSGSYGDVVEEWSAEGAKDVLRGGGFLFDGVAPGGLGGALGRALSAYRNPRRWRPLMESCMQADFGWPQAADATVALYFELLGEEG